MSSRRLPPFASGRSGPTPLSQPLSVYTWCLLGRRTPEKRGKEVPGLAVQLFPRADPWALLRPSLNGLGTNLRLAFLRCCCVFLMVYEPYS